MSALVMHANFLDSFLLKYLMDINEAVGLTLNDKYLLLEPAGRGGKSIVYKAKDLHLDRIVACKILLPELLDDETNLKRFRQEAVAAKRLDHQNINTVIDFGEWQGQPFMIMEYLDGQSLAEVIDTGDRLSAQDALSIFLQIAEGCAYAHTRNIIHRDLKPSNVILFDKGDGTFGVKIIDFGIAKIISENTSNGTKLTKTGDIFGSPLYMSPEQCMGKPVDHRSDIYSFAALMYEALTGNPPLQGPTAMVTIFKHTKEMPPKFGDIGFEPKTSQAIEKVVFKCLAKDVKHRYQSMDEIVTALKEIAASLPAQKQELMH